MRTSPRIAVASMALLFAVTGCSKLGANAGTTTEAGTGAQTGDVAVVKLQQIATEQARGVAVLLDGIPLTEPDGAARLDLIELAAARMRSLSAEELLERLQDRFRLLRGSGGGELAQLAAARRCAERAAVRRPHVHRGQPGQHGSVRAAPGPG